MVGRRVGGGEAFDFDFDIIPFLPFLVGRDVGRGVGRLIIIIIIPFPEPFTKCGDKHRVARKGSIHLPIMLLFHCQCRGANKANQW